MKRFVFLAQQPMDSKIGSNAVDMAHEIAKKHEVLYVNIPLDRITLLKSRPEDIPFIERRKNVRSGGEKKLNKLKENLWELTPGIILESINNLPDGGIYDSFNKLNNKRLAKEIKSALSELKWTDFYILNDSDMFRGFYMDELLEPSGMIYYSRDNLREVDYFKKHGQRLEPKLMAKSDLCISNSAYLRDECAKFNSNSFDIGQGCDLSLFDPNQNYERPTNLPKASGPIIGYVGALLSLRLDIPLLEELTERTPNFTYVLVGPEDNDFKGSRLHERENVVFTGPCKPSEAPSYMYFFDVCMNPQRIHPMTIGNYPRKIDEYLALGKPTLATKTRAMDMFAEHVYLGENVDDYILLIEKALSEDSEDKAAERRLFALEHSWENSIEKMYDAMRSVGLAI